MQADGRAVATPGYELTRMQVVRISERQTCGAADDKDSMPWRPSPSQRPLQPSPAAPPMSKFAQPHPIDSFMTITCCAADDDHLVLLQPFQHSVLCRRCRQLGPHRPHRRQLCRLRRRCGLARQPAALRRHVNLLLRPRLPWLPGPLLRGGTLLLLLGCSGCLRQVQQVRHLQSAKPTGLNTSILNWRVCSMRRRWSLGQG